MHNTYNEMLKEKKNFIGLSYAILTAWNYQGTKPPFKQENSFILAKLFWNITFVNVMGLLHAYECVCAKKKRDFTFKEVLHANNIPFIILSFNDSVEK